MAPGSCFHQNRLVDSAKNKHAGAYSLTGGFIAGSASLAQEFTPSTPVPPFTLAISTEKLIQLFMKTYAASIKILDKNQAVINKNKARKTPVVPVEPEESKELKPVQHFKQPKPFKKKSQKEKKK